MMRVTGRASVVRTTRVMGSGGVIIFSNKATEMASTNQFFNFILECFTFLCVMAIVLVIATLFSHVHIGGSGCLAWWWDEVGL